MKNGKYLRAARQLMMKQGPAYDRWKVAMEARGEQKRCGDCIDLGVKDDPYYCNNLSSPHTKVNPGQFACDCFWSK